ncbi:hypothetical protein TSUD_323420 [Trifolium subterraneum]|uniref:RRM domain-containing protein n=1 Tax=Trifolium subterraneum TaxID=3900 RepID=A0A2Z6MSN4_TRISU|nr:hypothetical protein TSUD_323420 [Trifolium subterraneum]
MSDRERVSGGNPNTLLGRPNREVSGHDAAARNNGGWGTRDDHTRYRDNFHKDYNYSADEKDGDHINGAVSFYYNNILDEATMTDLREEFGRCDQLLDVFISKRRNARGRRFGFVRYNNVRDKERMVRALNHVWLGSFKVCANVAVFKRQLEKKKVGEGDRVKHDRADVVPVYIRQAGSVAHTKEGAVVLKEGVTTTVNTTAIAFHEKTFVEALNTREGLCKTCGDNKGELVGDTHDNNPNVCFEWQTKVEDRRWSSKGIVGVVRNLVEVESLQVCIFNAGFVSLSVAYLGGRKVLFTDTNDKDVSCIISDAKEFFDKFLVSYYPWDPRMVTNERCIWLRIYGVPVHAWTPTFFKKLIQSPSKVEEVAREINEEWLRWEEENSRKENLDRNLSQPREDGGGGGGVGGRGDSSRGKGGELLSEGDIEGHSKQGEGVLDEQSAVHSSGREPFLFGPNQFEEVVSRVRGAESEGCMISSQKRRLHPKERQAMLEAMEKSRRSKKLKEQERNKNSSSGEEGHSSNIVTFSNSEDWRNWMKLYDDEEVTGRDVCNAGKQIGVIRNEDERVVLDHLSKVDGRGEVGGGSGRRNEGGVW